VQLKIIGLEEHFATAEIKDAWQNVDPRWRDLALQAPIEGEIAQRLLDFGAKRLAAMDEAGVDVAVLSLTTPGVQSLDADLAVELARSSNDGLAAVVRSQPDRFQGFATLPTPVPQAAAKELERAIRELGFHGAMLHGRTRNRNLSDEEFWPIFEAAEALRAPLYLHPQSPQQGVLDAYYSGFGDELKSLFARPGIGWHYETGIEIIRLILAGVFDRFPELQIITGHWGEVMLFYLDRIDMLSHAAKLPRKISEYVQQHVSVTASGIYSQRYLQWSLEVLGPDRILFATDYPYGRAPRGAAREFLKAAQISEVDRIKIASGNWDRLSAQIRR
jgi:predicted TIM-barrel fold metal-dependent hydrolase